MSIRSQANRNQSVGRRSRNKHRGCAFNSPAQLDWRDRCKAQSEWMSKSTTPGSISRHVEQNLLGNVPIFDMRRNKHGVMVETQVGIREWAPA